MASLIVCLFLFFIVGCKLSLRACSSVDRASGCGPGGRRFDSCQAHKNSRAPRLLAGRSQACPVAKRSFCYWDSIPPKDTNLVLVFWCGGKIPAKDTEKRSAFLMLDFLFNRGVLYNISISTLTINFSNVIMC